MSKKDEKVVVDENVNLNENTEGEVLNEEDTKLDEKDLLIKNLEEKVSELNTEIDKIKKAAADIVNRNKQMEIDKKYAASDLVRRLLVPMSYFEGALKFKSDDEAFNNFLKGFEMVYNLLLDQLYSDGLKEIVSNINDDFNPHIHEVTEVVEVIDQQADKIVEIVQKGFYYKDRVIKPTKVKVSKLKENKDLEEENDNDNQDLVN